MRDIQVEPPVVTRMSFEIPHSNLKVGCCWTDVRDGALYLSAQNIHISYKWQSCCQALKLFILCIGGIVDSIAASQAVDPGSIPGQCNEMSCYPSVVFESREMDRKCWTKPFHIFLLNMEKCMTLQFWKIFSI